MRPDMALEGITASAYTIPTEEPESDGTLEWDSTTIVVVRAVGGGRMGLGYTYTDESAAALIRKRLDHGPTLTAFPHLAALMTARD